MQFNEQIQRFVDAGLKATETRREETVFESGWDGAAFIEHRRALLPDSKGFDARNSGAVVW
jgi:hypothetical protein